MKTEQFVHESENGVVLEHRYTLSVWCDHPKCKATAQFEGEERWERARAAGWQPSIVVVAGYGSRSEARCPKHRLRSSLIGVAEESSSDSESASRRR